MPKAHPHDAISCTYPFQIHGFVNYLFGFSIIVQKNDMIQIASCVPAFTRDSGQEKSGDKNGDTHPSATCHEYFFKS